MGEELQVLVSQEVGSISWNFEQLKNALAEKMKEYDGLVYTEQNVKTAKNDVATLRKIKKAINDKRIEVKKMCLAPYEVFEAQAGELTELIDKPIIQIDAQLTDYEKNRREAVKAKVLEYMEEYGREVVALPQEVSDRVKELKYKSEWENATMTVKRWKQGVEDAYRDVARSYASIVEVEEEFFEAAKQAFMRNLDLNDAMAEVSKARKQKEIILAKERERIAAEERAKAEAEMRARMAKEKEPVKEPKVNPGVGEEQNTPLSSRLHTKLSPGEGGLINVQPITQNAKMTPSRNSEDKSAEIHTLRIKATPEQYAKIKGYINYTGAIFREV